MKILFVDDDKAFLDLIRQVYDGLSKGEWKTHCAITAVDAIQLLRQQRFDLVVLDVRMPRLGGLELLTMLNRDFPDLQKVFLAGVTDEPTRVAGLEEGAALFLEKPGNVAGMESIFATLNELVRWQRKQGTRGVMRPARLLDIVKMECLSGNSRLFEVYAGDVRGQIYIKAGSIIHARAEDRRGLPAFCYLACLSRAEFNLKQFVEPTEQSVDRPWEFLVSEAARLLDQMTGEAAEPKATEAAPLPATPVTQALSIDGPSRATSPVIASGETRAEPFRRAVAPADSLPPLAPRFESVPSPPPARRLKTEMDPAGFRVEEVLICSDKREVLYEWQCTEVQKRLQFMEYLSKKSDQLGEGLPLGKFDRIELQAAKCRMAAQFQGDRGILMRSNTTAAQPAVESGASSQAINEWLERRCPAAGVFACGVIPMDKPKISRSCSQDFPPEVLDNVWRCVADMYETSKQLWFPAWQLRWLYERAQLYCVQRADGIIFGVFLSKAPQAVDLDAVEQAFADFKTLCVA